jgi:hypothetical protein
LRFVDVAAERRVGKIGESCSRTEPVCGTLIKFDFSPKNR